MKKGEKMLLRIDNLKCLFFFFRAILLLQNAEDQVNYHDAIRNYGRLLW